MASIHQFLPAVSVVHEIDKEALRELRPDMSDRQFGECWSSFLAVRRRVENARRRIGGDVCRTGPVLFDPCQYLGRR